MRYPYLIAILAIFSMTALAVSPAGPQKLSSDLALAVSQYMAERGSIVDATGFLKKTGATQGLSVDTAVLSLDELGRAQVYLEAEAIDRDLLEGLTSLGVGIERLAEGIKTVQIRVLPADLEAVANLPGVKILRLPDLGYFNSGSIQTQGDAIIHADQVRNELNITGAGIRIGVIADGINGLTTSIYQGDIPNTGVTSLSFRADGNINAGSEGTAILEIIHDVAPNARLFFANFQTSIEFMAAQNWLADRTDVIVDAVSFFNDGPYNGTGPVATHSASIVGRGIPYLTAVGNYASKHYQGLFRDTNANGYHEFGQPNNAGETLNITLFPNSSVTVYLQWDDPWGASANDYDLFLTDPNNPSIVINNIGSRNVQNGTGNPVEAIPINYTGTTPVTFGLTIQKAGNAAAKTLELFLAGARFQMDEFIVPESSVPNNADAAGGVLAIGAMDYRSSGDLEVFSSRGATNDGRMKPDFVAPDGVSTGAPNFTTFFGTSASAAHAAGTVALILSASPNIAPAQVFGLLRAGAVDMGDLGPDNMFGYGRIDAYMPVHTLASLPPPTFYSNIDTPQFVPAGAAAEVAADPEAGRRIELGPSFEVAGWAIASRGVQRVDVILDGAVVSTATYGLPRLDVCAVFQNYPGCPSVGFVTQLNNVSPGTHTLAIRITDNTGNVSVQPQPAGQIFVEPSSVTAFIDSPTPDATVGSTFTVRGWAVSELGVRSAEIYLDGLLVTQAAYGLPRQDVCAVFPTSLGCPNVGFSGDVINALAGPHQLVVQFTDNGGGTLRLTRSITVAASEIRLNVEEPVNNATVGGTFRIGGWAIATNSVSRVEILVDNAVVTNATYGANRPDVCVVFPGFPNCPNVGFAADLTGLAQGVHTITVRVVDSLNSTATQSVQVTVFQGGVIPPETVIAGAVDSPTGGVVQTTFDVNGWAVANRGVQRVEILIDGAVLQLANLTIPRADVCAVYSGYPGCPNVGFTVSVTVAAGFRSLQIRVVDSENASAVFPETPINLVVSTPPTITVGAGDYRGLTSQVRPILIQVRQPNTIWQGGLTFSVICMVEELGITTAAPITITNGTFSHAGQFSLFEPSVFGTDGTFTVNGTFDPATNTFSGTLVVVLGPCNTGPIAYNAPLVVQ